MKLPSSFCFLSTRIILQSEILNRRPSPSSQWCNSNCSCFLRLQTITLYNSAVTLTFIDPLAPSLLSLSSVDIMPPKAKKRRRQSKKEEEEEEEEEVTCTVSVIDPTVVPFQLCSSKDSSSKDASSSFGTFAEAIASVAQILQTRKKILVLAGAGISVSCGIPDFRSPQGLYATLDARVSYVLYCILYYESGTIVHVQWK
jgi:hypothetical protein